MTKEVVSKDEHGGSADDHDPEILKIARELRARIGDTRLNVENVAWQSSIFSGRFSERVYSDQPSLKWNVHWSEGRPRMSATLVLPTQMRGKLEPEEWKPLLASFLVYQTSKDIRRHTSILAAALVASLIAILGTLFFLISNRIFDDQAVILLGAAILPLVFIPGFYLMNQLDKRAKLQADIKAAKLIGKGDFIRVLRKVDSLSLEDVEKLKKGGWRVRIAGRPSISKRIENLSEIAGGSS